jgi:hypothetical protein
VKWETNRLHVTSTKTERYEGKESRDIPLFPALRIELERLFENESSNGKERIINSYRLDSNLQQPFSRIVKKVGLEPIPKPFDNMRASRSTEIYNEFGAFLESKWIGHSSKIAKEVYLQVRDSDFERAVGSGAVVQNFAPQQPAEFSPGQIPGQQASESTSTELPGKKKTLQIVGSCGSLPTDAIAKLSSAGLEPVTFGFGGRMDYIAERYKNALFPSILTKEWALSSPIKHYLSCSGFIRVCG